MKAILEFDLNEPDDRMHHKMAVDSQDMLIFIWDVEQDVFRPHRKHGYGNLRLDQLVANHPEVREAISLLEEMYYELKANRFNYG
jgi:hypothetical protein